MAVGTEPVLVRLGLKDNLPQFLLLMLVNAFVGGMVGLERTVVPLIGTEEFKLVLDTVVTSFIVSFGITKALVNLASGALADRYGRKALLVLGWLVGVPVPFLIMWAPSWGWIVAANVLLGINQGLCWSMAVVMKIDLAGPNQRGLAVGLNEFAGYLAVGITALATGYIASVTSFRPEPFYLGVAYGILGLALSAFFVRDTHGHARLEHTRDGGAEAPPTFRAIFAKTSFGDRHLFSISQAGLVNNLNDGMSWGILPLFFAHHGLGVAAIGVLKFVYPAVWGVGQLATGPLSDILGKKPLIVCGMILQGGAVVLTALTTNYAIWIICAALLGIGTAMVYPALIAAISEASSPAWRARSLGVYRFWRDLGYAVGALMAGIIADLVGLMAAILAVGALTLASGIVSWRMMRSPQSRPPLADFSVRAEPGQSR